MSRFVLSHPFRPVLFGIGIALAASAARAQDDLRLGQDVVPTFESVRLEVDADQTRYSGSVRVELSVRERTSVFRFHALDMELGRLSLRGSAGEIAVQHQSGEIGVVTVTAATPLEPGDHVLEIDFANELGTQAVGLYRMEQDGAGYVFTQFEADDAREAFPCWDEPAFKIPYQLTLVVPEAHQAFTNTPVEKETVAGGQRTVVFQRTKPLPSYLLAIATGPLETVEIPGMSIPGRVVVPKGQTALAAFAVETTPPILAAHEAWFGQKYPFEKLDLIAVPEYWPGAMENPGAITYAASLLLLNSQTASVAQRRTLVRVTAHELAHMWFGDLVTMQWWDDLWLNESFADWLGDKIAHQTYPEYELELTELQPVQGVMAGDSRPSAQAIRRTVLPTDNLMENVGTQYNKGKAVLGMFETWVGPEAFRRGVLDYLAKHAWGNASAADLWIALSKVSGNDITSAMETFLVQPGLPVVSAEVTLDGTVQLKQERFLTHGMLAPEQKWQVPVTLRYSDGKSTRTRTVLLSEESQAVHLESDGPLVWLHPDADARGYYRWQLPPVMLAALANHSQNLTARERIGLLGNLSAMLDAGTLHGDDYLRAVSQFAAEPEPLVLSSVVSALTKVKIAFVPEGHEAAFAQYVRRTLGPAYERFGFDRKPSEAEAVSLFRPQLVAWLGDEGQDEAVLARAQETARRYLADPASVDPSLVSTVVTLSALGGDRALFDIYRQRFEEAKIPSDRTRFLAALGAFRDPALVEDALRYAVEGPLRPQELFTVGQNIGQTARGRDRMWRWITENFAMLEKRLPAEFIGFLPFFANGCEAERLEAARAFFSEPAHVRPGTQTSLAKVSDGVQSCTGLREREGAAALAYLNQLVGKR